MKKIFNLTFYREQPAGVHAITTFPSYQSLYQNLVTFGCEVDYWKPRYNENDSTWHFDLKDLQSLFKVYIQITANVSRKVPFTFHFCT